MRHLASILAFPALLSGDTPEWGGFRGNNGIGVVEQGSIPERLDAEKNLRWRVEVPPGYSSPIVAGRNVFMTAEDRDEKELLTLCVDRTTGEERWRAALPFDGKRPGANSSAAPSPVTDGERVVAMFHHFGMVAYDLEGEELWRKPMGPFNIPHGLASSPLIHGDTVVQCVDQDGGGVLMALDAKTGEELWKVDRPGVFHGYGTPALWVPDEGPAQVIVSGSMQVAGYSVADGEKVWWADVGAWQTKPVPIVVGDRCYVSSFMVDLSEAGLPSMRGSWEDTLEKRDENGDGFISKEEWKDPMLQMAWFVIDLDDDGMFGPEDWAYIQATYTENGGLYAIDLGGRGDVTETHVVWENTERRGLSDTVTPVVMDGVLYLVKDGLLSTYDCETGEVIGRERVGDSDQYFASPVAAGGRIVTAGLSGQLVVIRAGREWEQLSTSSLDEQVWSTPALTGDTVLVRSQKALYCFEAEEEG